MAFLGRESQADIERVRRITGWLALRSKFAIASVLLGLMAVVDSITLVIGVLAGVAAIVCAILGLRQIEREPTVLGRRLCFTGLTLGVLGLILTAVMWMVILPRLAGD